MRSTSNLGRPRFRIHYTWLFAIILIPAAVVTQFPATYPLWHRVGLGVVASLAFFLAIVIRDLILGFISARKGVVIEGVTLFVFGGLFRVDSRTTSPGLELLLAACGQLINIIIAGVFSVVYLVLVPTDNIMVDVLMQWLAFIWFMLALFHFVPGFPLDGGRALRALLWRFTLDYVKATRIAGWTSWGIGIVLTAGAIVLLVLTRELFTGIFLVVVGLILQNAATHSRRQVRQSSALNAQLPD